jgi:hypothetical protein
MGALVNMGVPNNPASAPLRHPLRRPLNRPYLAYIWGFLPLGCRSVEQNGKVLYSRRQGILEECRIDSAPSRFLADLQAKHGVPKGTFGSAPPTRMEIRS